MILTNNSRKMHNLPMWRKKDKRKRYYTRNEVSETIDAFLDYCNGKQSKPKYKIGTVLTRYITGQKYYISAVNDLRYTLHIIETNGPVDSSLTLTAAEDEIEKEFTLDVNLGKIISLAYYRFSLAGETLANDITKRNRVVDQICLMYQKNGYERTLKYVKEAKLQLGKII